MAFTNESLLVKFSDQIAKQLAEGTFPARPSADFPAQIKIESPGMNLYAWHRTVGTMEKKADPSVEISADSNERKETGAIYERSTKNQIEIRYQAGKGEVNAPYEVIKIATPENVDDPAKFGEKIMKKINTALIKDSFKVN